MGRCLDTDFLNQLAHGKWGRVVSTSIECLAFRREGEAVEEGNVLPTLGGGKSVPRRDQVGSLGFVVVGRCLSHL